MKKILLSLFMLLVATSLWSAKAWREPITVTQTDGTTLQAYVHGDEHFNWYATADGVILYREQHTFYIAAIHQDGSISSTGQLAHEVADRRENERRLIAAQDKELFFRQAAQTLQTRAHRHNSIKEDKKLFPHEGSPKAIVILANYQDLAFTLPNPRKSFNQFLNEKEQKDLGHGENKNASSVAQYFKDMSGGKFTPRFDVYGPITLPRPYAYYGGTNGNANDEKFSDLIIDACKLMDDSLNFADYDSNGDGYADLVYVIYAGYGQNMGAAPNTMWPKAGTIREFTTNDNIKVYRSGISNELIGNENSPKDKKISGIGLFCHEFSHCLGLPDFYPTLESARGDNQGMEAWSLMDDGEYVHNGYVPTAYTAWEREAMGWLEIETLKDAQQVKLENIDKGGKAYRIMNDAQTSGNEYYIVQNIQKEKWNKALGGHGLLMYHVNYDPTSFSLSSNSANNIKGKPRMTVVPADGLLMSSYTDDRKKYNAHLAGDPFPGTSGITEITNESTFPNYKPWVGETLDKPIYNITETDSIVYFDFLQKFATDGIVPIRVLKEEDKRIFSIDGRYMGTDASTLPKGIYIRNRHKFVVR